MKITAQNEDMMPAKGSYILVMELEKERPITVGSLGNISFPGGYYAYAGSALSGIRPRLERHLRKEKKIHWHIDYLLQEASINSIIICEATDRIECSIAQALGEQFEAISGFGCSDCGCPSHLFYDKKEMKSGIMKLLDLMDINPHLLSADDVRNDR